MSVYANILLFSSYSLLDYGYFGVLGAELDDNGLSIGNYTPKPSYYALQNLCSLLCDDYDIIPTPACGQINDSIFAAVKCMTLLLKWWRITA